MERWKIYNDIPTYEISNFGRVRNIRTGRILHTFINTNGYEIVQLHNQGDCFTKKIHRLVAETFVYNDDPIIKTDINHIDGNKLNNDSGNLEWCTRQENTIHGFRIGINKSHRKKKVRIVETGESFDSETECASYLGVTRDAVGKCVHGRVQTCRGYHIVFE